MRVYNIVAGINRCKMCMMNGNEMWAVGKYAKCPMLRCHCPPSRTAILACPAGACCQRTAGWATTAGTRIRAARVAAVAVVVPSVAET